MSSPTPKNPSYTPQWTWNPGGTIRQELTTTSGVQIRVKDLPQPEPRKEPKPPEVFPRVTIIPFNQSVAERNAVWRLLDETWGPFIIWALMRRGVRPASAKDIKQEVFLIVYQREEERGRGECQPEREGSLPALIKGIIPRLASNYRKLARLRAEEGVDLDAQEADGLDPEEAAAFAEYGQKLRGYLRLLTSQEAQVIELVDIEGMTLQEVADELGRPLGTVLTQRKRGREKLRECVLEAERGTLLGEWLQTGV